MTDISIFPVQPDAIIAGWLNVRDYGATGGGLVDDTDAIQAALDAAFNRGGGVVWFPPGDYLLAKSVPPGTPLRARSNVEIVGSGYSSRLIRHAQNNRPVFNTDLGVDPTPTNIVIRDLRIDGNIAQNDNAGAAVVLVQGSNNVRLERLMVQNAGQFQFAISVQGSVDVKVLDCILEGNRRDGISVTTCDNFIIGWNIIRDDASNGDDHIPLWGSTNGVVVGNIIGPSPLATAGRGIALGSGSSDILIVGNHISGTFRSCIGAGDDDGTGTSNIQLVGNFLERAGEDNGGANWGDLILIRSFDFVNAQSVQIGAMPHRNWLIEANMLRDPRRDAIRLTCGWQNIAHGGTALIDGFTIRNNQYKLDQSLSFANGTGRFLTVDQTSGDPGAAAITTVGTVSDLQIAGNRSELTFAESIYLKGAGILRTVIDGHTAIDCGKTGALVAALYADAVAGLDVFRFKVRDLRGTKFTDYGARFINVATRCRVVECDFLDTVNGNVVVTGGMPANFKKGGNFGDAALPAALAW